MAALAAFGGEEALFRLGLPLVSTDRQTWFQTEAGYVDHPAYQH